MLTKLIYKLKKKVFSHSGLEFAGYANVYLNKEGLTRVGGGTTYKTRGRAEQARSGSSVSKFIGTSRIYYKR